MDLGKLRYGEKIAGVSAVLLFVFMFLDWFGVKGNSGNLLVLFVPFGGGNAWQTLEVTSIFLVLAIVVAVVPALMRLVGLEWNLSVPASVVVTVFGGLASLLILTRIVFPPGFSELPDGFLIEPTLKVGVFLALSASLGIAFGGCLAMREEGIALFGLRKGRHRDQGWLNSRKRACRSGEPTGEHGNPASPDL